MTKQQTEVFMLIEKFQFENNRKPYLYEICEITGKSAKAVAKILDKGKFGYTEKLLITPHVKKIYDAFEPGFSMNDLGKKLGMPYNTIYNYIYKLEMMGLDISVKPYKKADVSKLPRLDRTKRTTRSVTEEEKPVYVKITEGRYKGNTGYIHSITGVANVVIYQNCEPVTVRLESHEYKELK